MGRNYATVHQIFSRQNLKFVQFFCCRTFFCVNEKPGLAIDGIEVLVNPSTLEFKRILKQITHYGNTH